MATTQSTDTLKALVDVDTALIAFFAIITVNILIMLNNAIQAVNGEMRIAQVEHEKM